MSPALLTRALGAANDRLAGLRALVAALAERYVRARQVDSVDAQLAAYSHLERCVRDLHRAGELVRRLVEALAEALARLLIWRPAAAPDDELERACLVAVRERARERLQLLHEERKRLELRTVPYGWLSPVEYQLPVTLPVPPARPLAFAWVREIPQVPAPDEAWVHVGFAHPRLTARITAVGRLCCAQPTAQFLRQIKSPMVRPSEYACLLEAGHRGDHSARGASWPQT